jgi:hypothetical protein
MIVAVSIGVGMIPLVALISANGCRIPSIH